MIRVVKDTERSNTADRSYIEAGTYKRRLTQEERR